MIHTTTNAIVNVPLNTPITDEDEFVLRRGTLTVTLEVIDHTEFQAQVQIPADQTTGEWTYTLGSNRGIIAITNPNGDSIQYGERSGSLEYDGRARSNGIPDVPEGETTPQARLHGEWVDSITATDVANAVAAETARAQGAEELLGTTLDGKITNEITNRQNADALLQPKTDNNLETTAKTVVGAINELYNRPSGGVEEAPEDGKTYGRKDGDWEEVHSGSDVGLGVVAGKICLTYEEN